MLSLKVGLRATAIYFTVIAIATIYSFVLIAPPTDTIATLARLLPVQIVLVGLCLYYIRQHKTWTAVGFGKTNWRALGWLTPSLVVMGLLVWDLLPALATPAFQTLGMMGLALLIIVPFLIGFSEEVMFRGILLRGALAARPVGYAMVLSAVLFALLHVVNGIVVQAVLPTLQQTLLALCVGLFLAPVALRVGNLWPLIIWHALWDIIVFSAQIANTLHPLVPFGMLFQVVICFWLWADLVQKPRR